MGLSALVFDGGADVRLFSDALVLGVAKPTMEARRPVVRAVKVLES